MRYLTVYFILFSIGLFGQKKSVKQSLKDKVTFDVDIGFNYSNVIGDKEKNIKIPEYSKFFWGINPFSNNPITLEDIPAHHGTTFGILKTKVEVWNWLWVEADFYFEHLGASYGLYNPEIVNIFPMVSFNMDRKFKLFKDSARVEIRYGTLRDFQDFNRLTIFGKDIQGGNLEFTYKKFRFQWNMASIYEQNKLNDPTAFRLFYTPKIRGNHLEIGIGKHFEPYPMSSTNDYKGLDFGLKFFDKERNWSVYTQLSSNESKGEYLKYVKDSWAGIIGAFFQTEKHGLELKLRAEARYYKAEFNKEKYSKYSNQVIPQYQYDRSYVMWSTLTEAIDYNTGRTLDVGSLNLIFEADYSLGKNAYFHFSGELVYLDGPQLKGDFLPFYKTGFKYKLRDNHVFFGITNKVMVDYLYRRNYALTEVPFFQLTMGHWKTKKEQP